MLCIQWEAHTIWSPGSLGYAGTGGAKDSELWEMLDVELFYVFASENARNAGIIENMIRGSSKFANISRYISIWKCPLTNKKSQLPRKRHHGWHRAGNVVSVNRLKWHFQSLRYALWWGAKITPKSIGSGECNPLENV